VDPDENQNNMLMNITHESMMALTADMPMKTIIVNGEVYLQRYFAHQLADGTQVWYHRFLRNDSERHLHTHPWHAVSTILVGRYQEEYHANGKICSRYMGTGAKNEIAPTTLHRIVLVDPNTWTMMIVGPERHNTWKFVNEAGDVQVQNAAPSDWHESYKARDSA
jgi:hypothetical protein